MVNIFILDKPFFLWKIVTIKKLTMNNKYYENQIKYQNNIAYYETIATHKCSSLNRIVIMANGSSLFLWEHLALVNHVLYFQLHKALLAIKENSIK